MTVLAATAVVTAGLSCTTLGQRQAGLAAPTDVFLHAGFGAGPVLFTDASGALVDERRHEPFGVLVDVVDVGDRDVGPLNKRIEPATGWHDHAARWLAAETARWLTPDPPVVGPDTAFMLAPWALHPYQFVHQNPVHYWDPDGRQPAPHQPTLAAAERATVARLREKIPAGPLLEQLIDMAGSCDPDHMEVLRNTAGAIAERGFQVLDIDRLEGERDSQGSLMLRTPYWNPATHNRIQGPVASAHSLYDAGVIFLSRDVNPDDVTKLLVSYVNRGLNDNGSTGSDLKAEFMNAYRAAYVGLYELSGTNRVDDAKSAAISSDPAFWSKHITGLPTHDPEFRAFVRGLGVPDGNLRNEF